MKIQGFLFNNFQFVTIVLVYFNNHAQMRYVAYHFGYNGLLNLADEKLNLLQIGELQYRTT